MVLTGIGSLINFISLCAAEQLLLCVQEDVCVGAGTVKAVQKDLLKPCWFNVSTQSCNEVEKSNSLS